MLSEVEKANIGTIIIRDISKKIKSTFKAKGESGKHVASSPPYGYLKDSADKNKWRSSTIAHILQRHKYLEHMVNFKTRKHMPILIKSVLQKKYVQKK